MGERKNKATSMDLERVTLLFILLFSPSSLPFFKKNFIYLFIWLHWVLVAALGFSGFSITGACEHLLAICGILFPDQGLK